MAGLKLYEDIVICKSVSWRESNRTVLVHFRSWNKENEQNEDLLRLFNLGLSDISQKQDLDKVGASELKPVKSIQDKSTKF